MKKLIFLILILLSLSYCKKEDYRDSFAGNYFCHATEYSSMMNNYYQHDTTCFVVVTKYNDSMIIILNEAVKVDQKAHFNLYPNSIHNYFEGYFKGDSLYFSEGEISPGGGEGTYFKGKKR